MKLGGIFMSGMFDVACEKVVHSGRYVDNGGSICDYHISENWYNALVLNVYKVFIADVDVNSEQTKQSTLAQIKYVISLLNDSFVVYETHSGFRIFMTNKLVDPLSEESKTLMDMFGADPRYSSGCIHQDCYRARLTPKPQRVVEGKKYSVCKEVHRSEYYYEIPEIQHVLNIHDNYTICNDLPLA